VGHAGRIVTAFGALGLVAAAVQVGHSGGTLVYRDGAASAYTSAASAKASPATAPRSATIDRSAGEGGGGE
jgi:hypothetical protein